jgi:hypothetical protein
MNGCCALAHCRVLARAGARSAAFQRNGVGLSQLPRDAATANSSRRPSRVKRRTSGARDGISAKAGSRAPISGPRNVANFNIRAVENNRNCTDDRVMRSGKTEYAMGARGMIGAGRKRGRALSVMETKLDSKRAFSRVRRERKSAEHDQQALRGHRIGNDNANQRPQQAPQFWVEPEYASLHNGNSITRAVGQKRRLDQLSPNRVIWATGS